MILENRLLLQCLLVRFFSPLLTCWGCAISYSPNSFNVYLFKFSVEVKTWIYIIFYISHVIRRFSHSFFSVYFCFQFCWRFLHSILSMGWAQCLLLCRFMSSFVLLLSVQLCCLYLHKSFIQFSCILFHLRF